MLMAVFVSATVPAIPLPIGKRISPVPTPWAILLHSSPLALSTRNREHRSASTTRAAAWTISLSRRSRSRSATSAFATSRILPSFVTRACRRSIAAKSSRGTGPSRGPVLHDQARGRRICYCCPRDGQRGRSPPSLRDEPGAHLRLRHTDAPAPRRQRRLLRRVRVQQGRIAGDGREKPPPTGGRGAARDALRAAAGGRLQGAAQDVPARPAPPSQGRDHLRGRDAQ